MRTLIGLLAVLGMTLILIAIRQEHKARVAERDSFGIRFNPPTLHRDADGSLEIRMRKLTKEQRERQ